MKKVFVAACLAMLSLAASAQVTWNAKLGGGFSSCTTDGDADLKSMFVGKVGVGVEYPLSSNLSLMPSLELALKGAKTEIKEEYGSYSYSDNEKLNLTYLQIPVLAAYRLNLSNDWNMTIKAGLYFAYALSGKLKIKGTVNGDRFSEKIDIFDEEDMDEDGKTADRFDVGIDLGVDFEYHRFVIGAEFERGFMNFFPKGDGYAKVYNQAFYVTVGYKF